MNQRMVSHQQTGPLLTKPRRRRATVAASMSDAGRCRAADITQIWSIGSIAGTFTGTQNIGSIQSYSSISATINSGNNQTGLPSSEGNIQSVQAWGDISGSITASNDIQQVVSANAVTAAISVGAGGQVVSIIANDKAITQAAIPVSSLNMAAFQAAMNQFANAMTLAAQQEGTAAGEISQALASVQALVTQDATQAQAANRTALATAQGQIAAGSSQAVAQIAAVSQDVTQAQATAIQQINQAETNAQTQDQQLNQQSLDQLATAQKQVSTEQANLQSGITASQLAVQNIQSLGQQEISTNVAQLAKDNGNRAANWATDANGLIEQVLVHPLQEALNYVAMGAGFLALVPGLEPMLVVAGAASLANAGLSALEGSYMSAGMYAVTGLIPLAGKLADIGEMADGADAALTEATPEVQAAFNDAGQETSNVLAADGVESSCAGAGGTCFVAGTQVITAVNAGGGYTTEAIQNITVGQTVLTKNQYDPTGPLQQETVTAVQVHTVYSLRDVTLKNADGTTETIDTTDSHPFYVQGQGWVSADDLIAGETLSTPDGQTETVVGTTSVAETQGVLVYNFTVADDHTYFVEGFGSAGISAPLDAVWVHNSCTPLRGNLIDQFGSDPGSLWDAHHIVAQGAPAAQEARDILARAGILIHDAENGVFLPRNLSVPSLGETFHQGLNTNAYTNAVTTILRDAENSGAEGAVARALQGIRQQLLNGSFPF